MRARTRMIAGLIAVVATGTEVWAGGAGPEKLGTRVRLLVGRPPATGEEQAGVFLLPGTVVVPGGGASSKEQDLTPLKLKLLDTYRLAELDVASESDLALELNRETSVVAAVPGVDIRLTLLGYDEHVATYRVFLKHPGSSAATPTVSVSRGERGIVGGRDGKEAPYLFLILEPAGDERKGPPGDSMVAPTLVSKVNPKYPEEARKKRITGIVRLELLIKKDGTVGDVEVLESPDASLSEAAAQAVRQWRYRPPKDAAGVSRDLRVAITVKFALQ